MTEQEAERVLVSKNWGFIRSFGGFYAVGPKENEGVHVLAMDTDLDRAVIKAIDADKGESNEPFIQGV